MQVTAAAQLPKAEEERGTKNLPSIRVTRRTNRVNFRRHNYFSSFISSLTGRGDSGRLGGDRQGLLHSYIKRM